MRRSTRATGAPRRAAAAPARGRAAAPPTAAGPAGRPSPSPTPSLPPFPSPYLIHAGQVVKQGEHLRRHVVRGGRRAGARRRRAAAAAAARGAPRASAWRTERWCVVSGGRRGGGRGRSRCGGRGGLASVCFHAPSSPRPSVSRPREHQHKLARRQHVRLPQSSGVPGEGRAAAAARRRAPRHPLACAASASPIAVRRPRPEPHVTGSPGTRPRGFARFLDAGDDVARQTPPPPAPRRPSGPARRRATRRRAVEGGGVGGGRGFERAHDANVARFEPHAAHVDRLGRPRWPR